VTDPIETMRVHRRFTLTGRGTLVGDPNGAWMTVGRSQELIAAERARIRHEMLAWAEDFMRRGAYMNSFNEVLDRICPAPSKLDPPGASDLASAMVAADEEPGMFEGQRFGVGKWP